MWDRLAKIIIFMHDEIIWRQIYILLIEIEIDTTFLEGNFAKLKKSFKIYVYTSTNLFY